MEAMERIKNMPSLQTGREPQDNVLEIGNNFILDLNSHLDTEIRV